MVGEQWRQRMQHRGEIMEWYKTRQRLALKTPRLEIAHPRSVKEIHPGAGQNCFWGNKENKQQ